MSEKKLYLTKPPRKQKIRAEPAYDTGKGYSTFFFNLSEEAEIEYWSFEESRDFIRPLMFPSKRDYKHYSYHSYQQRRYGGENYINRNNIECPVKPAGIPDDIVRFYKDDWVSDEHFFYGDIIGEDFFRHFSKFSGKTSRIMYTYSGACKYMRQIGLETIEDFDYWNEQSKKTRHSQNSCTVKLPSGKTVLPRPDLLPISPIRLYTDEWVCLQEYIGIPYTKETMARCRRTGIQKNDTSFKPRNMLTYKEARVFMRACGLKSVKEYGKYRDHVGPTPYVTERGNALPPFPNTLPAQPQVYYTRFSKEKSTWISWYDFIGIERNVNHDKEIDELMEKAMYIHYRSFAQWCRENKIKESGYSLGSYAYRKIKDNDWVGWYESLNRRNNSGYCSFQDAKILLSFQNLPTIAHYNTWRKKVGSPFFLPVLSNDEHISLVYSDEEDASLSNFLSLDLGDKIQTQAKAVPVLAITVIKDQQILVNVIKPGKFEAFIHYRDKPNCYLFDNFDKTIWAQLLERHCIHEFGGNVYYVKHMGMLYQDLTNNFRRMNLARIYD